MADDRILAVEAAIEEYKELGEKPFLKKYKLRAPRTTYIQRNGEEYPAKAIWVAAHINLKRKTRRHTTIIEGQLGQLGFTVIKKKIRPRVTFDIDWSFFSDFEPEEGYFEGIRYKTEIQRTQRSSKLVEKAKKNSDYSCQGCGFNIGEFYGGWGKDYIEAHHIDPLSNREGEGEITNISELVMLCSNCHRMVHKKKECLTLEELRSLIAAVDG